MSSFKQWRYICLVAFGAVNAQAEPTITVYTTKMYPIQNPHLATQIYYLDQVENFEEMISQNLSKNPATAEKEFQALIQSPEWQQRINQLKEAYQGVISGWQNGIKKVPAVLFDSENQGLGVVYGTTDIKVAKNEWERWAKQNGETK